MRRNKIAFFIIDYSFGGGVERVNSDLSHLFQKNEIPVTHLITFKKEFDQPKMDYHENLTVKVLSGNKNTLENEIGDYLKKEKIDVLIFQADNMTISLSILAAAKKIGCKAIAHYHGSPFAYLRKYPEVDHQNYAKIIFSKLMYPFKKSKLKKFLTEAKDGVVCVSDSVRKELNDLFPENQFNISTIHNPTKLDFQNPDSERENNISFVSRLEKNHKNAFLSVKSWAEIAQKFPEWKLHIFGTGNLMDEMKSFVKQNHIHHSVVFHGFERNVRDFLKKSKICLSTSNCEGFSMAVMEAIEAGNAIVSTKSDGGVSDMVQHEKTGLFSPKNDQNALAKNIEKIILNDNFRLKMAAEAQQQLKKIYEKDIVELWKDLIFK